MKKKSNAPRFSSLRQFSWSGKKEKDKDELLIEATALEWFDQKHRRPSPEEVAFVNSIPVGSCPYCGVGIIAKDGRGANGVQRYVCRGCGRRFNPLTGTIFDSRKIPISEWVEFLLHLFEYHSVKTSALDNRNSKTTGEYWLSKVFAVLEGIQDGVVLRGRVYIDEKLFDAPNSVKEAAKANGGSAATYSGSQYYVATGTDRRASIFLVMGRSKPSERQCLRTYGKHIREQSLLVHDGESSHGPLVDALALRSEVHPSSETRGLRDSENPMDPINDVHDKMEKFMAAHSGYDRSRLQDWMNLFWFIWCVPGDKMDKVKAFIGRAVLRRARVKYRDRFGKKDDES